MNKRFKNANGEPTAYEQVVAILTLAGVPFCKSNRGYYDSIYDATAVFPAPVKWAIEFDQWGKRIRHSEGL